MPQVGQPVLNIFGEVCAVSTGATIAQMRRFIQLGKQIKPLGVVMRAYRKKFLYGMADEGREAFLTALECVYLPGITTIKELP